jgi:hypothetical protein
MIIIEGLDATGKSTLADSLSEKLHWPIISSEGPEKYPGEIIKRCYKYSRFHPNVIYDRHPIISQSVYSKFSKTTRLPPNFISYLREQKPIIIYSSAENKGAHVVKRYDTKEHLAMIAEKRLGLEEEYLKLLDEHFPYYMVYKFGDLDYIVNTIHKKFYG